MKFEIEAGKYYLDGSGTVVGPIVLGASNGGFDFIGKAEGRLYRYNIEGQFAAGWFPEANLVRECDKNGNTAGLLQPKDRGFRVVVKDCTCDIKALFSYGHERGCQYARI